MVEALREALPAFDNKMSGYAHPDAVLTGVETRTSSPLRIPRDAQLESLNVSGLTLPVKVLASPVEFCLLRLMAFGQPKQWPCVFSQRRPLHQLSVDSAAWPTMPLHCTAFT